VDGEAETRAANCGPVISFSARKSLSVMCTYLHGMQLHVKHDFASAVIAFLLVGDDDWPMPPIAKPPRQRQRTFLREWRQKRGLKQYEAAERLEIEPSTLSRLENGQSPYDQDILERIALIYGCESSDLISINPLESDNLGDILAILRNSGAKERKKAASILEAFLKAS